MIETQLRTSSGRNDLRIDSPYGVDSRDHTTAIFRGDALIGSNDQRKYRIKGGSFNWRSHLGNKSEKASRHWIPELLNRSK